MSTPHPDATLFAGPLFGEFGHEVLGVGLLRARVKRYGDVLMLRKPFVMTNGRFTIWLFNAIRKPAA